MKAVVKHIKRKLLGDQRGETLIETLAAIVICTLATVVLLSATVTAVNLNKQANDLGQVLQQEQQAAELSRGTTSVGTVTIKGTGTALGQKAEYDIDYYGGEHLRAYRYSAVVPAGS